MCVNDILANGGEPLFFLDYLASSKIKENQFLKLVLSINLACAKAGCSLVGGETAEMPGMYNNNEFDLAGFAVGAVERKNLLKKKNVKHNSLIIGIESSGFHSNGFSLIRKILENQKISLNKRVPYKSKYKKLGDDLLIPTRIYVKEILPLIKKKLLNSVSHITGGGIYENLSRIIPDNHQAVIDFKKFDIPERFLWLQKVGHLEVIEMLKTFNCGIGLIMIIDFKNERKVCNHLKNKKIKFHLMGKVKKKECKSKVLIEKFGRWHLI